MAESKHPVIYDLMLILSSAEEEDVRRRVLSETEAMIEQAGGRVLRSQSWGRRPLAYKIAHQPEGHYHLIQFSGPPQLIESLQHALRIEAAVLRSRIIKVLPGQPAPPDSPPPLVVGGAAAGATAAGEDERSAA
jgi:small subunit ribosomal protein S6